MSNMFDQISPWQLFLLGGPVMWPILLCSIFALAIAIEKAIYYSRIRADVSGLKRKIFDAIKRNDVKGALAACDAVNSPTARVMHMGLLKFGTPKAEIAEAMEEAAQFEVPRLEKRLPALSTIGNVTPLLGLLGTVSGMCAAFHTIQVRAAAMDPVTPGDIAGGIWAALITTVAGLVVAIPTFVAYNYFVTRVNRFTLQMEKAATDLANFLSHLPLPMMTGKE